MVINKLLRKRVGIENLDKCTGCCACMNICIKDAISMKPNKEGFWFPEIDYKKCVGCRLCVNSCQILNEKEFNNEEMQIVYAAWSNNMQLRIDSTSGGIFSEFALLFFEKLGSVSGAIYGEDFRVEHYITENREDLAKIRQSKYTQSYSGYIYNEVCEKLINGQYVLFCGTPCQIDALLRVMKKRGVRRTDKLLLVDFICRGSNSPKVYDKFLRELEVEYGAKVSRVWFKNKDYGWNNFHTRIEFENGKVYSKSRYEDPYIRGYIEENLSIRNSCTDCRFKGTNRLADITLGDFWGGTVNTSFDEADKGTSVVMINTQNGMSYWNKIRGKLYYERKKIEDVRGGNTCLENSIEHSIHRKRFMKNIDRISIIKNLERYLDYDR